jgi:hypothetical protein
LINDRGKDEEIARVRARLKSLEAERAELEDKLREPLAITHSLIAGKIQGILSLPAPLL